MRHVPTTIANAVAPGVFRCCADLPPPAHPDHLSPWVVHNKQADNPTHLLLLHWADCGCLALRAGASGGRGSGRPGSADARTVALCSSCADVLSSEPMCA